MECAYNIMSEMQQILLGGGGVGYHFPRAFFYNSGKRIYSVTLKRSVAVHPSVLRFSLPIVSPCHLI